MQSQINNEAMSVALQPGQGQKEFVLEVEEKLQEADNDYQAYF